jgi:hypothetical protein
LDWRSSGIRPNISRVEIPRCAWRTADDEGGNHEKAERPRAWTHGKIRHLIDYYDKQSGDELLAEYEAACAKTGETMISVPTELVPAVLKLIAQHQNSA